MTKKALLLLFIISFPSEKSFSDTTPGSCNEIFQVIIGKSAILEESANLASGKLTPYQIEDAKELLRTACSQQYSHCGLSFCKRQEGTVMPTASPTDVTPELNTNSVKEKSEGLVLDWITSNLSCEDFLGELRNRYQTGKLTSEKRKELKVALECACRENFKHCQFDACQKQ